VKVTNEELKELLSRLPEEKRRALLTAWRDEGARAAARINAALEADAARGNVNRFFEEAPGAPRGSKYGNQLVEHEGELFHSKGELQRFRELQLEQRAGLISNLQRQVEFPIAAAGVVVCSWFADFVYQRDGREVVEDFKGFRTDIYKLKKKFVEAIYKIRILETGTKKKTKERRATRRAKRR
jgi:hypothetical protein